MLWTGIVVVHTRAFASTWLTHETNANAMLLYDRIATKSGFVQYRHLL